MLFAYIQSDGQHFEATFISVQHFEYIWLQTKTF